MGGIMLLNQHAPAHHRAGMFSAGYLAGYLSQGTVAVSLGVIATHAGIGTAIDVGAVALGVIFLSSLALATTLRADRVIVG
jgi:hypothetical protein